VPEVVLKLKEIFKDDTVLGTRYLGNILKEQLENNLNFSEDIIIIDFDGIEVVTHSFLDQAIGTLIAKYGTLIFKRTRLINVTPAIKSLALAIKNTRLQEWHLYNSFPVKIDSHNIQSQTFITYK